MECIRRNLYFSLLLHLAGIAAVCQIGVSEDTIMKQLINVSLLEEADSRVQAGEKNLSPALPLREEPRQSDIKKVLRSEIEKVPEDSSGKSAVHEPVRPDNHIEEVLAPAVNIHGNPASIAPVNKAVYPLAENASGTYSSSAAVPSAPAMQVRSSGGDGQRGHESSDSYQQTIRNAIQRNLVYPYIARKRRKEGTALVEFKINQRGMPEDFRIIRSSGHLILDIAAKETVVKASPFPTLNNTIEIPITFILKDGR